MSDSRKDEPPRRHFRSDRCILVNGAWYVATREGIDIGPYWSREAVDAGAKELAEFLRGVETPEMALTFIREFARRREN